MDSEKAEINRKKHEVSFDEAKTVFDDPLARIFNDEWHSKGENREIIIGNSERDRLLIVCFTERGDAIRIFSSRKTTTRERNDYEKNK